MMVTLWIGFGVRHEVGDERVPRLVVGRQPLLILGDDERAPLAPHEDLVLASQVLMRTTFLL